jgi:hypothetical protein
MKFNSRESGQPFITVRDLAFSKLLLMASIRSAPRKPISILVIVMGLFFFGVNAVRNIKIDIFPELNLPVIYISHPYGGFTPTQMEAIFAKNYVSLLLYVSGVKSIETRNSHGLTLIKLTFYQGTNMAQATQNYPLLPIAHRPYSRWGRNHLLFCALMPPLCPSDNWF